jgi:hypothetical protein
VKNQSEEDLTTDKDNEDSPEKVSDDGKEEA